MTFQTDAYIDVICAARSYRIAYAFKRPIEEMLGIAKVHCEITQAIYRLYRNKEAALRLGKNGKWF